MISSTDPDFTAARFHIPPNTKESSYIDFDVEMRDTPTVSIYSPSSGTLTDPYNRSAGLDMRLTSSTTGYGGIRTHSTGSDTVTIIPNKYGLLVSPESGYVIFDEILFHYVADSEYTL
jgi:hypothetical protein